MLEDGPPLEVQTALTNRSRAPLEVVEFPKSCGCITTDAAPLPWLLQPGESRPVKVRIALQRRNGPQDFSLSAVARAGDGKELRPAAVSVHAYVTKPLTAIPPWYYAPIEEDKADRRVTHTFVLGDDVPGAGPPSLVLSATRPDRTQLKLRPASGTVNWIGVNPLKKRFELDVTYDPPPGAREYKEKVTLTPVGGVGKPVVVEFFGSFVPAVSLEPEQLIVRGTTPKAVESRIVECRFRDPRYAAVRVESGSPAVTARKEGEAGSFVRFRVSCTMPERPSTATAQVKFLAGDRGKTVTLPVTMVLDPPDAGPQS